MVNKLLKLWNSNKILFWILFPLIAIAFIVNLFLSTNKDGVVEKMRDIETKDGDLKTDQEVADSMADKHKDRASGIEFQIKKIKESEGDENWHEKI
jgi:hypothetical protein